MDTHEQPAMEASNPLKSLHEAAGATFMRYADEALGVDVVETFGSLTAEYAAIRKSAALLDTPHRGTIEVTGADRIDFLNRMLTQELKGGGGFEPYTTRRSFWLNRKGRIDADLRLLALPDRLLMDCEVLSINRTITSLSAFLFAEDVQITDITPRTHRLSLHGPRAAAMLQAIGVTSPPARGNEACQACGNTVFIDRDDTTGEPGFELLVDAADCRRLYDALTAHGARPIGWHAYNIARIEAGTPLFNIDFASNNLPHETGPEILNSRVSFRKGCYLGQEIVARMQSLGHPKQVLVALRIDTSADAPPVDQPETGSPITLDDKVVGAVTSCTRSPMLSDAIIAFAHCKWDASKPNTELAVAFASGARARAVVQEHLAFWRHADAATPTNPA